VAVGLEGGSVDEDGAVFGGLVVVVSAMSAAESAAQARMDWRDSRLDHRPSCQTENRTHRKSKGVRFILARRNRMHARVGGLVGRNGWENTLFRFVVVGRNKGVNVVPSSLKPFDYMYL